MNGRMFNSLAVASAIAVSAMALPAMGAITFLDHFNGQTNFNLNPAYGDYAGGSGAAVVSSAAPGTGPGYFGGADLAYHATVPGQNPYLDFDSPGNIEYASPTSGGVTVGYWYKMSGAYWAGYGVLLGDPAQGTADGLELSYGEGNGFTQRALFTDAATGGSGVSLSWAGYSYDWMYVAATVDLTNQKLSLYTFDSSGNVLSSNTVAIPVDANGWNVKNLGQVRIGGQQYPTTTDMWLDEVSIDDEVLSQAQIQARVNSMVAGHELAVPEPATLSLIGLTGLLLIRRRRSVR